MKLVSKNRTLRNKSKKILTILGQDEVQLPVDATGLEPVTPTLSR